MPANGVAVTATIVAAMPGLGIGAGLLKPRILQLMQTSGLAINLAPLPGGSTPGVDAFAQALESLLIEVLTNYATAVGSGVQAGVF